ncbi:hypothetical protein GGI07_005262 [Coemansia sp. Benny D115]|nr:hypothetical protein GGI07_005262 [Coemansia sp. Benny D115]
MSRLKRASTISTVDSRMHSLLIPSDSRAAHNIDRFVAVSSGADMDADIMFPRWGNAPSVSSFMMADGSVDGRSPYLCHSASRSIGSRGLDSGSATTRSSTTLWLAPVPKTPQSLTPTAKRSNERSFVVHTAAEQCEWRQSWDVI